MSRSVPSRPVGPRRRLAGPIALAAMGLALALGAPAASAQDGEDQFVPVPTLDQHVGWSNVQLRQDGAIRHLRDYEREVLLGIYERDPSFPSVDAIRLMIELRAKMEASRRSPDGRRVDAINSFLEASEAAEKAMPFFKGGPKVFVDSVRAVQRLRLKAEAGRIARADAYTSTVVDSNARNKVADPRDTYVRIRARAEKPDPANPSKPNELELAYNRLYAAEENNPLLASAHETWDNNPHLREFAFLRDAIDQSTGQLKTEIRGGVRVVRFDLGKLRKHFDERMDAIGTEVTSIQKTLESIQSHQVALGNSFLAFMEDEEKRRLAAEIAEREAKRHEQLLAGLQSSVQLLATIVGGDEGRYMSTIGNSAIQIGESINRWTKVVASVGDLADPLNLLNTVTMVTSVIGAVQAVVALFDDPPPPSVEELIYREVGALRKQVADLGDRMERRFDRLDAALNAVYDTVNHQFAIVQRGIADLDIKVEAALKALDRSELRLKRLDEAIAAFAQAEAVQEVQDWIDHAYEYDRKHPGASGLPYDEFTKATSKFWGFAVRQARSDPRLVGTDGRPVTWEAVSEQLERPIEGNLGYLDAWSQALLSQADPSAQGLLGASLVNPRAWAWASQAFAALALDRPDYAERLFERASGRSAFFEDLIGAGRELERGLGRIARSKALFTTLLDGYDTASTEAVSEAKKVQAAVVTELVSPREHGTSGYDLLWDDLVYSDIAIPAADLLDLPSVPGCNGGGRIAVPANVATSGTMPHRTATTRVSGFRRRLDSVASLAERLDVREARMCWHAQWVARRPTGVHRPTYGRLQVEIRSEVRTPARPGAAAGPWTVLNTLRHVTAKEVVVCAWELTDYNGKPRWVQTCTEAEEALGVEWRGGLLAAFESLATLHVAAEHDAVAKAIAEKQERLRQEYEQRIGAHLTEDKAGALGALLRHHLQRAEGHKALIAAYAELGLPRAFGADEALQMLLRGPSMRGSADGDGKPIPEDGAILGGAAELRIWMTGRPHPERSLARLAELAPRRAAALRTLVGSYQAKVHDGSYREDHPLVARTLFLLEGTRSVVLAGLAPGEAGDGAGGGTTPGGGSSKVDSAKVDSGDGGDLRPPDEPRRLRDTRAPDVRTAIRGRVTLKAMLAAGIRVRQRCSEDCIARVELVVDAATAGRMRAGRRAVVVGATRIRLQAGRTAVVTVRVRPGFASRLRRARPRVVLLRTTAADAAGNRSQGTRRLALR